LLDSVAGIAASGRSGAINAKHRATAYHEAGHAVVAYWLGFAIRSVTVLSGTHPLFKRLTTEGRVDCDADWVDAKTRRDAQRCLVFGVAGPIAEAMASGPTGATDTDEFESCRLGADRWGIAFPAVERQTRAMLRRRWRAVKAVAEALMAEGTLTGTALKKLIKANTVRRKGDR
jgi:hypothetical protein